MTERKYTAQDAKAFTEAEEQLSKNGLDKWTQEGTQHNADLIDQFFQANPTLPVTLQNIYRAVETRKIEFAWLSTAAANWYQTAQQNPELANQLAAYLATRGRPGQLVNEGDSLFENLVLLFNELHSHPQPMAHAIDRISHRPGRQLHFVPQPRRTESQSRAAKEDDGQGFLRPGEMVKNADGSWRSKNPAEERAEREATEAAERAKSQSQTQALDPSEASWKGLADGLLNDGTHSQQVRVREVYDHEVSQGSSWRKVFEACKAEANAHSRTVRGANGFMDEFKESIRFSR